MLAFDTLSVACGATFPVGEGFLVSHIFMASMNTRENATSPAAHFPAKS